MYQSTEYNRSSCASFTGLFDDFRFFSFFVYFISFYPLWFFCKSKPPMPAGPTPVSIVLSRDPRGRSNDVKARLGAEPTESRRASSQSVSRPAQLSKIVVQCRAGCPGRCFYLAPDRKRSMSLCEASQIGGVAQQGHGHVQNTASPPALSQRDPRGWLSGQTCEHMGFVRHAHATSPGDPSVPR